MSAFNNYEKDQIVDSVREFIEHVKNENPDIKISSIIAEATEAFQCGLVRGISDIEE